MKRFLSLTIFLLPFLLNGQDAARQIWDTGFLQKRPAQAANADRAKATQPPPVEYRTNAPLEQQKQASEAVLGVTLWKLRPPRQGEENGARLLLQDAPSDPSPKAFVPERADIDAPLHDGDRIRLSIESPRAGFLYVIDRERYSDGTTGDPVLIYPAGNFSAGTNDVEPGRIIEIPPQNSKIPALKVARSGDRHIGEELLVVVVQQPIHDLKIEDRETRLRPELVATWEREWGVEPVRLSLAGGEPSSWTTSEKAAGENQRLLTQDDPMPQVIFSVNPARDKALLLRVPLTIGDR